MTVANRLFLMNCNKHLVLLQYIHEQYLRQYGDVYCHHFPHHQHQYHQHQHHRYNNPPAPSLSTLSPLTLSPISLHYHNQPYRISHHHQHHKTIIVNLITTHTFTSTKTPSPSSLSSPTSSHPTIYHMNGPQTSTPSTPPYRCNWQPFYFTITTTSHHHWHHNRHYIWLWLKHF